MTAAKPPAWWANPALAGLAVSAYGFWCCRDLAAAWRSSPYDAGGWLVFLAWLLPLFVCRRSPDAGWLLAGLAILGLAGVTDLNVLAHLGLTAVLAACVRPVSTLWRGVWLAGAPAWMPGFGYVLDGWPAPAVFFLRILLVTATLPLLLTAFRQARKGKGQ